MDIRGRLCHRDPKRLVTAIGLNNVIGSDVGWLKLNGNVAEPIGRWFLSDARIEIHIDMDGLI